MECKPLRTWTVLIIKVVTITLNNKINNITIIKIEKLQRKKSPKRNLRASFYFECLTLIKS